MRSTALMLTLGLASLALVSSAPEEAMAKTNSQLTSTKKLKPTDAQRAELAPEVEAAEVRLASRPELADETIAVTAPVLEASPASSSPEPRPESAAPEVRTFASKPPEVTEVEVRARPKRGLWRAGMFFGPTNLTRLERSRLTDAQLEALIGEPKLEVVLHFDDGTVHHVERSV